MWALSLGAKVVWLPTQSAKNHMQKMNQDPSQSVEAKRWKDRAGASFRAGTGSATSMRYLGTAYIAPEEIFTVVEAARYGSKKTSL